MSDPRNTDDAPSMSPGAESSGIGSSGVEEDATASHHPPGTPAASTSDNVASDEVAQRGHSSPPWGLTTKAIVASAALIGITLVIWRFQSLLSTLVLAAMIAYLLNPAIRWLQRKTGIRRGMAVFFVYLFLLFVVGGAGAFIGVTVAEQVAQLWNNLPESLPQIVDQVQQRTINLADISVSFGPYTLQMGTLEGLIDWDSVVEELRQGIQTYVGQSGMALAELAQATLSTVAEFFLVVVISIYIAIDAPRIGSGISATAQQPGYREDAERLIADTILIWNAYLRGQVILGIIIGLVVWLSLTIAGVNNALELGLLSGLLEFLPVIGPVIGTGAAVLVALLQDSNPWGASPWVFALIVLGIMMVIQQVENSLLVPRIVGEGLDLHPIVVMVGVIMGASLAGLLGAVLAAPVLASLKLYGTYVWRKMLDVPPFPVEEYEQLDENPAKEVVSVWVRVTAWWTQRRSDG